MDLLLIMPNFFDYPQMITEELEKQGYRVVFFDDRPSENALIKAAIRINPNIIKVIIENYFNKMMKAIDQKVYDIVLVISGQSLSFDVNMMKELRKKQNKAKFILYQWDSKDNFPQIFNMHQFFDKIYSFDKKDCINNKILKFLPLFFSEKYELIGKSSINNSCKYDCCFIGTAHPKKYKFIKLMSEQLRNVYSKQFIYFYLPSYIVYIYRKIKNKEFKNAQLSEFNFAPIKGNDIVQLFRTSKCILDSPQDNQNGLTIRVLEALGAKKKLITTNEDVINYDFYREENIYIYNGKFDFDNPFFLKPYVELDNDVYEKYTLRRWLQEVLE